MAYFDNPGTDSPPASILIVDPPKSLPIGWNRPPRCVARSASDGGECEAVFRRHETMPLVRKRNISRWDALSLERIHHLFRLRGHHPHVSPSRGDQDRPVSPFDMVDRRPFAKQCTALVGRGVPKSVLLGDENTRYGGRIEPRESRDDRRMSSNSLREFSLEKSDGLSRTKSAARSACMREAIPRPFSFSW
jgi:hypothetical protein